MFIYVFGIICLLAQHLHFHIPMINCLLIFHNFFFYIKIKMFQFNSRTQNVHATTL